MANAHRVCSSSRIFIPCVRISYFQHLIISRSSREKVCVHVKHPRADGSMAVVNLLNGLLVHCICFAWLLSLSVRLLLPIVTVRGESSELQVYMHSFLMSMKDFAHSSCRPSSPQRGRSESSAQSSQICVFVMFPGWYFLVVVYP